MGEHVILFADNDRDFLAARKELLERAGYRVLTATNAVEAKEIFDQIRPDLVLLDIRLEDDADKKDTSGLNLAKEIGRYAPTIVLTAFPDWELVRDAMRPSRGGRPFAVDFLAKSEGADALARSVRKALLPREVFIVHGHDGTAKLDVARFVEKLGLRAVILHEQPNEGHTIIEKLEEYSKVGFVVVLLTPDDVGGLKQDPLTLMPRARQNVIFELGFFVASLGRRKTCALYVQGVELPSDYQGVLYIPMDTGGGWKLLLAKEIRVAGIDIDLDGIV